MSENPQQYVNRMLGNVEGDPLEIQATTGARLWKLIQDSSPEELTNAPMGRWSIVEILAHLADTELVVAFRLRKILAEPGCSIPAYDQNAWASAFCYRNRSPLQSVQNFMFARRMNLDLLKTLTESQWGHAGVHEERGKETVAHIVQLIAGHDINHCKQIEMILATQA